MIAYCPTAHPQRAGQHKSARYGVPCNHKLLRARPVQVATHTPDRTILSKASGATLLAYQLGRSLRGVRQRSCSDPLSSMPSRRALLWLTGAALLSAASTHESRLQVQALRRRAVIAPPTPEPS